MRLGVCAGHSTASPGAVANGQTEQGWCRRIVDELVDLAAYRGWQVVDPRSDCKELPYPAYLHHRIAAFEAASGLDLVLDVHLNAWVVPGVNYSLTIYGPSRADSRRAAETVATRFERGLPWPSRGARSDVDLGQRLLLVRTIQRPAIIVEPLFLTNQQARDWLSRPGSVRTLARLIADGLEEWYERSAEREPDHDPLADDAADLADAAPDGIDGGVG